MADIFINVFPFFAVIGCGYASAKSGWFTETATKWLTGFVFYFALPAMLFRFSASTPVAKSFSIDFLLAYLLATLAVYFAATTIALIRRRGFAVAAVEAQCSCIGNVGFIGIPMLYGLLGNAAIGPIILYLALDLIIFGTVIVVVITASRAGRLDVQSCKRVLGSILANPMILSISGGLIWAALFGPDLPRLMDDTLDLAAGAATPCALFAIGAFLAPKSAERREDAVMLSTGKLVLHPLLMAFSTLMIFDIDPAIAGVMIAAAAMPTAGNIFILASHYGVAAQRVASTILLSTVLGVLTISLTLVLIDPLFS
ncbi:MAG: AEC family transporter [Rhodobacteraceae bacterium]|nr:AEC family transporter [Paracoccaceae bacterium]